MKKRTKQQGAALIEALVSILIMSLGLLGIAGIQLNAIAYQKSSWATHRVAEITNDFAERIRSNPAGVLAGSYAYSVVYSTAKAATFTSNNCRSTANACSGAQIAADDVAAFVNKAQTILPQGAAQVSGSGTTGYVVTVMYMDKDFVNTSGTLQSSATCANTTTGMDWRNCCPTSASAPAGIRCRNFSVIP